MEALRLLLAAVLLPAQFLVAGPAAANDPLVFRAQQKLTNLALQLPFSAISALLRRHGSEIRRGGCCGRGCAGAVGLVAA
jgi:hypothetical protein